MQSEQLRIRSARAGASVTLSEVARLAGVSESTVSRVLRRQGASSEKVRARVRAAVEALGYVPNRIAGTLASAGSNLVGVVIASLGNVVFPDLLRGVSTVLDASGYQPVIGVTDYDIDREEKLVEAMLAWRPAALVVTGLDHSPRTSAMLRGAGIRIAEVLDVDGSGIDLVVGYSNSAAGEMSAMLLLRRGHYRIGYVGHDLSHDHRAEKRRDSFRATLAREGAPLVAETIMPTPSSIESGRDGLALLLAAHPDLDAVYFSNDDMALGGLFHCRAHGIAIPADLAVMGYNGLDITRLAPQPLTTILTPRTRVGEVAAALLFAGGPAETVDLGFELIEGATV